MNSANFLHTGIPDQH